MVTQTRTRHVEPDITVVEIAGRLALGNTLHALETTLLRLILGGARKLAIDLNGADFIDSAAIGVLMGCNGQMTKAGGRMRVAGARGPVAVSFQVAHLDRIMDLDADIGASCRALAAGGASSA